MAWAGLATAGVVAAGWTATLDWLEPNYRVSVPVLLVIALAGASIVMSATWPGRLPAGPARRAVVLLGVLVLTYPTLLALAAARVGGAPVSVLALIGHIPPLVLTQVVPVLASPGLAGRRRGGWLFAIIAAPVLGAAASLAGSAGGRSEWLAGVGALLWLGGFVLAPLATWTSVHELTGEARLRAIVAGLAAVLPVLIITVCLTLAAAAATHGLSDDAPVQVLMLGFGAGTLGAALLASAAVGRAHSTLLRRRAIVTLLGALLLATTVMISLGAALGALSASAPAGAAVLVGVTTVVLLGFGALKLFGWAGRGVDPTAELVGVLAAHGPVGDRETHAVYEQALRQTVGDPGLRLLLRATDGVWLDAAGAEITPPGGALVLDPSGVPPSALSVPTLPESASRVARLGDIGTLLRPAVLAASVVRQTARADAAAQVERARLSQALHDGVQGRLLGIALNLQLSGEELEDPVARLLVEQTVGSLREAVQDVRDLSDGRLPATLIEGGLAAALGDLVRPLDAVVDVQVPPGRYPAELEATCYFVVSEAVGNALKHSRAQRIVVRVEEGAGALSLLVSDDGVGGADPRLGSGLRGLAERVATLGGALVVGPNVPSGTVVEASLPCGS